MNNIGNRHDMMDCDGMQFECVLNGRHITGVVSVCEAIYGPANHNRPNMGNKMVFLCNKSINGRECKDQKGFPFSYNMVDGSDYYFTNTNIQDFKLLIEDEA